MRISGEHAFAATRAQVWTALQDPRMLASALPGAQRLEPVGPDAYAITVKVGVGAVRGVYDGTFALEEKRELESCVVRASASGGPGSVEAVAQMTLRDADGGGALLAYEADASVAGPLAGVGQRLIGVAARKTTREFLAALERELAGGGATEAAAAATDGEAQRGEPAADASSPARFLPAARAPARVDPVVAGVSALAGFLLALIGVGIGWRMGRRS